MRMFCSLSLCVRWARSTKRHVFFCLMHNAGFENSGGGNNNNNNNGGHEMTERWPWGVVLGIAGSINHNVDNVTLHTSIYEMLKVDEYECKLHLDIKTFGHSSPSEMQRKLCCSLNCPSAYTTTAWTFAVFLSNSPPPSSVISESRSTEWSLDDKVI